MSALVLNCVEFWHDLFFVNNILYDFLYPLSIFLELLGYVYSEHEQDIFSSDKSHRENVLFSFLKIKWHSATFIAANWIWELQDENVWGSVLPYINLCSLRTAP